MYFYFLFWGNETCACTFSIVLIKLRKCESVTVCTLFLQMWKSVVGHNVSMKVAAEGDDWETDPDFENNVSEQEQRWGAKTIEGSGRKEPISIAELRDKVAAEHEQVKHQKTPKASYGYGGKFGVETDRMDKVAVGHDYVAQVQQHSSQKDAAKGFGGKFGVEKDRLDKSAVGFEYKGEVQQHMSQKDYSKGFGGKYGVEKEKVDKAAMGYDYKCQTEKHQSQRDYSKGFGGKYGVEKEKVDKAAVGYDYKCQTEKHQSQKDYSKGFGGKYGVEKEKVDKAAVGYDYKCQTEKHQSQKDYSKGFGGKYGVEKEKVDKAAVGYDYKCQTEKHQSQKDYSAGFGGRYGVQSERMDKSAVGFSEMDPPASAYEKMQPVEASGASAGKLKARFESLAKASDEENRRRVEEEKSRRKEREKRERQEAERIQQEQKSREDHHHPADVPKVLAGCEEPPEISQNIPEEPEAESKTFDDEPPTLPRRSDYFLQMDLPLPPVEEAEDADVYNQVAADDEAPDDYENLSGDVQAVAIYDYQGEDVDEISFNPDDVITDIEMIDEGWWKGRCHGRTGLFPAVYVQLIQ
ncbi:src substrate protein p85-like isoform X2 [Phyllopteryx taeniolatus]|uniref:src substrate protein p85-like isoform X2 n=1 Tax=Phyllopteryx taeniolatus TaxID=161469 RepID=UPI002AD1FDB6|nr:src substrate protein p85-like isoform X2 [Phyllopteryx taeniolatus]